MVLESERSKIKAQAGMVSGEGYSLFIQDGTVLLYPPKGKNAVYLHGGSWKGKKQSPFNLKPFYEGTNPIYNRGALVT